MMPCMRWSAGFARVVVAAGIVTTPIPALAQAAASAPVTRFDPSAEAAYTAALELMRQGEHSEAIERLDLAIELEPRWAAPVRVRAEAFGKLADRYRPSEMFLAAQATDIERLLVLEPGVDTAARQQQVASLRVASSEARTIEQKRRNLARPAMILVTLSAVTVISGALLVSFIPSTTMDAYRQHPYVYSGAAMMAVGAALAVPAITLAVMAGRQGRRDSKVAEFNVRTDRPHTNLALAPQPMLGGGGMALRLRF
jgi:hypothetical protein